MRKIYSIFFLVAAGVVMTMVISACSKNEDDIAAPSIKIYKDNNKNNILAENDTVSLTTYPHVTYLNVYIEATNDNVPMKKMTVELICLSDPSIKVPFSPESFSLNNEIYYYYGETFTLNKNITEITRMQLNVTCENIDDHTKTLYRKFYIKP
jgi:hypothetical protein